jgi:hypothetical protein
MAQIPAAVASTATASIGAQVGSFVVNLGANYLLGRLAAQDGPRLGNLSAAGGEYGGAMPKLFGEKVRCTGIFIAQADIKETRHTVEDYSEIVGALTGAVQGFMVGGPVGAVVGAVIGGLLGAATPNQHYYTYSDTFALLLADRFGDDPIEGINKMWAAGKVIFAGTEPVVAQTFDGDGRLVMKKWGKNKFFKSLTLHTGADVQALDPVLGTVLGETSGYPFTAYVTFEDLQLMAWGNSVPAVDVLTSVATGQTVAGTVERIAGAAGIDTERDISTLALVDRVNRGYSITSETSCWDAIKPLLPAFGVDAAEVSGQIRFIKRNQALRATIPPEDMGAHAFGDEPPERFTFARATDLDLPKETSLTFIDPARDYQANTASSTRTEGSAKSNLSVTLPLVLTADEGASTAALMHWDSWLGRTSVRFALTDAWLGVDPGAAYAVPFHDLYVPYRVTRRARGANGVIEVEALSDEEVTYTAVVAGSSGTLPDEEPTAFARDAPGPDRHADLLRPARRLRLLRRDGRRPGVLGSGQGPGVERRHDLRHFDRQCRERADRRRHRHAGGGKHQRPRRHARHHQRAHRGAAARRDGAHERHRCAARRVGELRLRRQERPGRVSAVQDGDESGAEDVAADQPPPRPQGHGLGDRAARRGRGVRAARRSRRVPHRLFERQPVGRAADLPRRQPARGRRGRRHAELHQHRRGQTAVQPGRGRGQLGRQQQSDDQLHGPLTAQRGRPRDR